MEEGSDQIRIKIRPISTPQFDLEVSKDTLVSDLKQLICEKTEMPTDKQRLIYQGKVLNSQEPLGTYKVDSGHVIQLVSSNQSAAPPTEEVDPRQDPLTDILRLAIENNQADLLPRRRPRTYRRRDIDNNERLETIRQTLQTIEGMFRSMNAADSVEGFDLARRVFYPGQWVDVKDTVDQWLEAQIVDVQQGPGGTVVYVHYNGWPTRWDEWIDSASPRIQPIRTHTLQSLAAPMQSPYPSIPCDAEGVRPAPAHSLNEYILQASTILERVKEMMERYYSLSTLVRHEQAEERVQTMRERLNIMDRNAEESKNWEQLSHSEASVGSDFAQDLQGLDEPAQPPDVPSDTVSTQQQLTQLTSQIAPILDRTGRLITDLASFMAGRYQPPQDPAVQSGDQTVQIPVMPSPLELASLSPRSFGPDIDIHVHAVFSQRNREAEPGREPCWRQIS